MNGRGLPRVPAIAMWLATGAVCAAGCSLDETTPPPSCGGRGSIVIIAQSVPDAAFVPCIDDPGSGWGAARVHVDQEGTMMQFTLGSDARARGHVQFAPACEEVGGTRIESGMDGVDVRLVGPAGRHYTFDGGCIGIRIDGDVGDAAVDALIDSVVLVERARLAAGLRRALVDDEL